MMNGAERPDVIATENHVNKKESEHDPHYDPIISLPLQDVKSLEEEENELFEIHAKLFRWASECDPPEWKERGTGSVKLLQHKLTKKVRLLMRRDKTLKICANHFVESYMNLVPNCGSDRAWVWNVLADFSEEEPKKELLAIRFFNTESSQKFKQMFDKVSEINENLRKSQLKEETVEEKDEVKLTTDDLQKLAIKKNGEDPAEKEQEEESNVEENS